MAHPFRHAESSAKKFGGKPQDYLPLHAWFDESKAYIPDFRHRCLRHHSQGIFLLEQIFGVVIVNSRGTEVPVRYIGEMHVKEDLGWIPTAQDWLSNIKPQRWMYGLRPADTGSQLGERAGGREVGERWRAITHLYTDVAEIWSLEEDGRLRSLVAEVPIDSGVGREPRHALARRIASVPDLTRALESAPQPPRCGDPADAERQAAPLNWLADYVRWFEGQRKHALSTSEVET
jgi:hypothetical protein